MMEKRYQTAACQRPVEAGYHAELIAKVTSLVMTSGGDVRIVFSNGDISQAVDFYRDIKRAGTLTAVLDNANPAGPAVIVGPLRSTEARAGLQLSALLGGLGRYA